jgi:hypothetical protein
VRVDVLETGVVGVDCDALSARSAILEYTTDNVVAFVADAYD